MGASLDATLSGFTEPFSFISEAGLFGKGLGMGTAAGSALMTGSVSFLLAEGEWSRVILESGPLLGFSFLAYRAWVSGYMASRRAGFGRAGAKSSGLAAGLGCLRLFIR